MLKNTFIHMPGIGAKTEQQLWEKGILDWDGAMASLDTIAPGKRHTVTQWIDTSRQHLSGKNHRFFTDHLPAGQHWRLFPEFKDSCAYIDIETTGLEAWNAIITTIALYDGDRIRYYVNGRNLHDFVNDIKDYELLVTYNGKTFDIPFIQSYFNIQMDQAHIDLRYVLGGLGYKGGLKKCEKALGIDRGDLDGVDGFFAVLLWKHFEKTGDEKALETLLAYNIEDVVNLQVLMVKAFNMNIRQCLPAMADDFCLPEPSSSPDLPFTPDTAVIDQVRGQFRGV